MAGDLDTGLSDQFRAQNKSGQKERAKVNCKGELQGDRYLRKFQKPVLLWETSKVCFCPLEVNEILHRMQMLAVPVFLTIMSEAHSAMVVHGKTYMYIIEHRL